MSILLGTGITVGRGIQIDGTIGARQPKEIQPNGTVITQSTSNYRFGSASLYNDGTQENFLRVVPYESFSFGVDDFTIEFWVYPTNDSQFQCMIGFRPYQTNGPYLSLNLDYPTTDTISVYANDGTVVSAADNIVPNNTWTSIALVQHNGVLQWYINGVASGDAVASPDAWYAGECIIGVDDYGLVNGALIGYMDEMRISSVARYTSNYTPATQAFTNDSDTVLLLHFDGTGQTFTDDAS